MKRCKRLLSVMLAFCMMLFMALPVRADATDVVNQMRNGVLQVELNWINNQGGRYTLQTGSGFLINDQTLLTNQHVVEMDADTKVAKSQECGVDFVNDTKLDVRVQVVVTRDVVVDATIVQSSREMDVAILELDEPIYDRTPLALGNSGNVRETSTVYALGFPWTEDFQDVQYYTSEDVSVTSNVVAKKTEIGSTPFIQHSATITRGNSGGPLVALNNDQDAGAVVGINTAYIAGEPGYYYAMEIDDIKSLLNALGITYTDAEDIPGSGKIIPDKPVVNSSVPDEEEAETETEEEQTVDTADLRAAISAAQDKQTDGTSYTEESLQALDDAIENANAVLDDTAATQSQVDQATEEVESATDALEEEAGMNWLVWVIVAVILVIVIVVVVVLVITSSNKNKKAAAAREEDFRRKIEQERLNNQTSQRTVGGHVNIPPSPSEGAGETSVLGEGRGETTVLNAGAQASAYMIRKKTNERVPVSGPSFTIGKERSRVNYCISDNTSVSRCHARIMRKGAQYFVTDMNSTNYTFVNGVKVMPGQEVQLNNGDIVRFADEDFEFHTN